MSGFEKDPNFIVISGFGADQGFSEEEAYALLAGLDNTTSTVVMPMVAAVDSDKEEHTGAMVALVPSDPDIERLAVEGGEPVDQLHLTLMFLGEAADISENARKKIIDAVERYTSDTPMIAQGFSVNVFNPMASNSCIVLGVGNDDGSLQVLQSNIASSLGGLSGLRLPEQHTPWVPHVTLQYTDEFDGVEEMGSRTGPITFDKLRVAFGSEIHDIQLGNKSLTASADWDPNEHPRGHDGQFIEKLDVGDRIFGDAKEDMFAGQTNFTPEQRKVLHGYTDRGYKDINPALRNPSLLGKLQAGKIKIIKSAMSSIKRNTTVFRKVPFHTFGVADGDFQGLGKLTDKTYVDKGFMSTSISDSFTGKVFPAAQFATMEIQLPKGTRAAYIAGVSEYPEERELLLDSGVKFKVKRVMMTADGPYMLVQVVEQ